jgi:hypothetical protein
VEVTGAKEDTQEELEDDVVPEHWDSSLLFSTFSSSAIKVN